MPHPRVLPRRPQSQSGGRQTATLTNKDSILCATDTFELRRDSASSYSGMETQIFPAQFPGSAPSPHLRPGDSYEWRVYNHQIFNQAPQPGYRDYIPYGLAVSSPHSGATEHQLLSHQLTSFDDFAEACTTMSQLTSTKLPGREVKLRWPEQDNDYLLLDPHLMYRPHPRYELYGYAIWRKANNGPWVTLDHVVHVGTHHYDGSAATEGYAGADDAAGDQVWHEWIDHNVPNSGGTITYRIALVDLAGNEDNYPTHRTSQTFSILASAPVPIVPADFVLPDGTVPTLPTPPKIDPIRTDAGPTSDPSDDPTPPTATPTRTEVSEPSSDAPDPAKTDEDSPDSAPAPHRADAPEDGPITSSGSAGVEHLVIVTADGFEPPSLSIAIGDRVTWYNAVEDASGTPVDLVVYADDSGWETSLITPDMTQSVDFDMETTWIVRAESPQHLMDLEGILHVRAPDKAPAPVRTRAVAGP